MVIWTHFDDTSEFHLSKTKNVDIYTWKTNKQKTRNNNNKIEKKNDGKTHSFNQSAMGRG